MDFKVKIGAADKQRTDCLVLPVVETGKTRKKIVLTEAGANLDKASGGYLSRIIKRGDIKAAPGSSLLLHDGAELKAERVLLLGAGDGTLSSADFIKLLQQAASQLKGVSGKDALFCLEGVEVKDKDMQWQARQLAQQLENSAYSFNQMKSSASEQKQSTLAQITLLRSSRAGNKDVERGLTEGLALAHGMAVARDLGNLPGNICTPKYLANEAKKLAKGCAKLTTKVLGEKQMTDLGMHSFMSVAKGSTEEGQLITMEYKGGKAGSKPYVLLGKGITFDTGGISLKPGAAMDEMKFDMCGAASVMGTMAAIVKLGLPINVVGMIAAAENMPAGNASKPGDIVTTMSGQTVEILNTDAEGRLVLCDALTYAERYKPKAVIDIATLTGACVIALGQHVSAVLSNSDELAQELVSAGQEAADKAWQMPLFDEYQAQLDSNFADMANIGGRPAGTITAGCFLSRFAKAYDWAHIDIAGTASLGGANKGATGRPVPLLLQFLLNNA